MAEFRFIPACLPALLQVSSVHLRLVNDKNGVLQGESHLMKIIIIYTKVQTRRCHALQKIIIQQTSHYTHPCLQSSPVKSYHLSPLVIPISTSSSSLPLLAGCPKNDEYYMGPTIASTKRDDWNPAQEEDCVISAKWVCQAMCALKIFKSPSAGWVQKWILNSGLMKPCARLNEYLFSGWSW